MNEEQIKQLAEQADIYFSNGATLDGGRGVARYVSYSRFEQFAELIVRECIDIVSYGGEICRRPILVEKLQEHFGVE